MLGNCGGMVPLSARDRTRGKGGRIGEVKKSGHPVSKTGLAFAVEVAAEVVLACRGEVNSTAKSRKRRMRRNKNIWTKRT